jgi:hypothetical protein
MMGSKRVLQIFIVALAVAGCNSSITDYVKDAQPGNRFDPGSSVQANGLLELKRSPGSINAVGTNAAVKANITASNKILSANGVAAKISISRARPTP